MLNTPPQPYDTFVTLETSVLLEMDQALNELVALTGASKRSLIFQALSDFLIAAGVWYSAEEEEPTPKRTRGKTRNQRSTNGKETS
jgi:hypothetical protein